MRLLIKIAKTLNKKYLAIIYRGAINSIRFRGSIKTLGIKRYLTLVFIVTAYNTTNLLSYLLEGNYMNRIIIRKLWYEEVKKYYEYRL